MKTAVPAAILALAAALLTGCSSAPVEVVSVNEPTVSASPRPVGTIAPVQAAGWDPAKHPDRVKRADFIARVATEYTVWEAGKSWRVSGSGWEPGEEIIIALEASSLQTGSAPAGSQVRTLTDANGGFVVAYPVPADTAPGDSYEVRATGRMDFGDEQLVRVVAPG